jgi:hypothetical protein
MKNSSEDPNYFGSGSRGYGTTWSGEGAGAEDYFAPDKNPLEPRYAGKGPKSHGRTDDRICDDVCVRLTDHPHIDATDVQVEVSDGVVTLSGNVHNQDTKQLAEQIASSVMGVRAVHNELNLVPATPLNAL